MTKLFILAFIAAFTLRINADVAAFAGTGLPGLPNFGVFSNFPGFPIVAFPPIKMLTPEDIKKLGDKDPNAHVIGASVSSISSSESVNGVPVKKVSKQRVVTNHDGVITDNTYEN